jgi:GNAT superfamily N-acetyltransferase
MRTQEIALAADWAAAEGWNPGLNDAACFATVEAAGFLIGELDRPAATISCVNYDDRFAFLGFYIVRPDFRGRGLGLRIWQAAIAHAGARTIGLDGVVAQQDNYRRSGFSLAYRNVRYQGTKVAQLPEDRRIVPLSTVRFDELDAYDRSVFLANRPAFLKAWIGQPQAHAIGILRDDRLAGYGVIRPARVGFKIGPLFADDPALAEGLFDGLVAHVPSGSTFFLDVPEANPAAVALAESHAMSVVFETARMYSGKAPDLPVWRLFGVTTFELG